jgi:eukaryotic-like serine/threonine-protein kinase
MTPERWQQVKALFQTAVEGEANQRAAFLDDACAGDPALRKQVEALIASHEQEPSFLESPGFEVMATSLTQDDGESLVGQNIGSYEVLREIGWGGMGEVYRAHDGRLDRDVAFKVVSRHLADNPEALARFEREAKALAALSHPNILAIHELATDQGNSYAVMELLEGDPCGNTWPTSRWAGTGQWKSPSR